MAHGNDSGSQATPRHPAVGGAPARADIERIVSEYADLILRLGYARLGSIEDARDICQTVLLKLLRASEGGGVEFADAEHEKAWIIRTTITTCIDACRSAWRSRVSSLDELRERAGVEPSDALPPGRCSGVEPSADAATGATAACPAVNGATPPSLSSDPALIVEAALDGPDPAVLAAVNKLPPAYRQAVYLHYYEGYSVRDIAALTGEREGTVSKHLSRARAKLRTLLEGGAR